jgi:DNA-binding CsgD family transcriptional regulator
MTPEPTPRQWQVERLLADGLSQAAIGARLGISRNTVKNHIYGGTQDDGTHRPGLYERIGARNRTHAAAWWETHGRFVQPFGLNLPEAH